MDLTQEPGVPSTSGTACIYFMPDDVLVRIARHLTPMEVLRFGASCRRFAGPAAEDRLVWAPICSDILGPEVVASPQAWGLPSFRRLYCDLLRIYSPLLRGPWVGDAAPLGSLLVVYPEPPAIVGGIVACLRLAEPTVSAVPLFRVEYDASAGRPVVRCLRGGNTFKSLLQRLRREEAIGAGGGGGEGGGGEGEEQATQQQAQPHEGQLLYHYEGAEDMDTAEIVSGAGMAAAEEEQAASAAVAAPAGPEEAGGSGAGARQVGAGVGGDGQGGSGGSSRAGGGGGRRSGGRGRKEFSHFTFVCRGVCCHTEVEAVCRWNPLGLTPLQPRVFQPRPQGSDDSAGAAAASSASSPAPSPALPDLDVLAAFQPVERVTRVTWTLHSLLAYDNSSRVSYRRLSGLKLPPDLVIPGAAPPNAPGAPGAAAHAAAAPAAPPAPAPAATHQIGAGAASSGASGPDAAADSARAAEAALLQQQPSSSAASAAAAAAAGRHPLEGLWRGTYGAHGIELLAVQRIEPHLLEARKLTGDDNVPAGAASFRVFLDRPGARAAQRGAPFHLPPDYASRADLYGGGGGPGGAGTARPAAPPLLDAYAAAGQVAGSGFDEPQWIEAEMVVLGGDAIGLLWHGIRSFSAFRRMRLRTEWGDEA